MIILVETLNLILKISISLLQNSKRISYKILIKTFCFIIIPFVCPLILANYINSIIFRMSELFFRCW